jgi:HSP20 family protein
MRALIPPTGLSVLRNEMDRLFDRLWDTRDPAFRAMTEWVPPLDLTEKGDAFIVRLDVPGFEPKDVQVTVRDGVLVIRGENRIEREDKAEKRYHMERMATAFTRTIPLPMPIDPKAVTAEFVSGVLTVTLPKAPSAKELEVPVLTG